MKVAHNPSEKNISSSLRSLPSACQFKSIILHSCFFFFPSHLLQKYEASSKINQNQWKSYFTESWIRTLCQDTDTFDTFLVFSTVQTSTELLSTVYQTNTHTCFLPVENGSTQPRSATSLNSITVHKCSLQWTTRGTSHKGAAFSLHCYYRKTAL